MVKLFFSHIWSTFILLLIHNDLIFFLIFLTLHCILHPLVIPGCGGVVSCCVRCSRVLFVCAVLFASACDVHLLSFLNDVAVLLLSLKKK
jgi:hypothetical protein